MPVKYDRENFREHAHGTQRFAPQVAAARRRRFGNTRERGIVIIGTSAAVIVLWALNPAISSFVREQMAPPAAERVVEGIVVELREPAPPEAQGQAVVRVPVGDGTFVRDAVAVPPDVYAGLEKGGPVRVVLVEAEGALPLVGGLAPAEPASPAGKRRASE